MKPKFRCWHQFVQPSTKTVRPDRISIDARGDAYWIYKEDWTDAFEALLGKGLIGYDTERYYLTDSGRPLAERYRSEKPDMYWYYYQVFYSTARASETYSTFCEKVFGKDLCQDGQTDMASLAQLLDKIDLHEGERVIDLGCGAGVIAEYISDVTGAHVTGIDNAETAIADANRRTYHKQNRLNFIADNFNSLTLEESSYNAIVSLDTLYWASDLEATLAMLVRSLTPGGRLAIFMNHHIQSSDSKQLLGAVNSDVFKALKKLDLAVEVFDFITEHSPVLASYVQGCHRIEERFRTRRKSGNCHKINS